MGNAYAGQGLPQQTQTAFTNATGGYQNLVDSPGALGQTNLQPYMNPYQKDVTDATMGELNRQETMQGNNLASQATQQGAFGGDRFAVQQAENNRNFDMTRAQTLAGLNQGNFNQAQQGAQFDINNRISGLGGLSDMSNMGFGFGQQLQQNQLASGAMQQQMQQQLIDAAKDQYGGYTGQGQNSLQAMMQALTGMFDPKKEKGSSSSMGITGK